MIERMNEWIDQPSIDWSMLASPSLKSTLNFRFRSLQTTVLTNVFVNIIQRKFLTFRDVVACQVLSKGIYDNSRFDWDDGPWK